MTSVRGGNQVIAGSPGRRPTCDRKEVDVMATCSEMKVGEIYVCQDCGLELQVVRSCSEGEDAACACAESISCCGGPLVLKAE
jgi:hypothetical protein